MTIDELKVLASRYGAYLNGDASLFSDVNAIDKKVISKLKKEYLDSVNRGRPVQLFRFVLLNQIEQGISITPESFERTKNKLEKRDVDDYDFLSAEAKASFKAYPKKQKSFFVNWKNPATILFPFLYTEDMAVQVKKSVEDILDSIIKSLKLTHVAKHIVDFNGPQNYGSGRCWGSIYADNKPSHKDAYQLHFTLGANGFEGALYSGTNIPRESAVDEREPISTLEGLISFLSDKKERWLALSNQAIESKVEIHKSEQFRIPLNQIFYGPPGTGKTYHTISESVKIVEELSDVDFENKYQNNRTELRKVYERYVAKGQIAFTTFHQSLSYEDFIEGIKPQTVKQSNGDTQVTYEVKPGIFKSLCENAEGYQATRQGLAQADQNKFIKEDFSKAQFYKMSLGNTANNEDDAIYEYCIKNNVIGLGWGDAVDFTECKNETDIKKLVEENNLDKSAAGFMNYFKLYIKTGNYVIISKGNFRFRAIGKITGDYKFDPSAEIRYYHYRSVDWIIKDVDLPVSDIYTKDFSQQTLYKLTQDNIKFNFFDQFKADKKTQVEAIKRNYVLIIDEINRGNVSQVFGELITLLEEDKRKGNAEELFATLPYSLKPFSIPNNLYLIGTMNTADKSVEALDSALRRRFFFKQMLPNADLLSPELVIFNLWEQYSEKDDADYNRREKALYEFVGLDINHKRDDKLWEAYDGEQVVEEIEEYFSKSGLVLNGISLKRLLNAINFRIEKLLGIDHTIGHAYFINIYQSENPLAALRQTFGKNILPLLQEYFYGDYGKIGLVLGDGFVTAKKDKTMKLFGFKEIDQNLREDYESRTVYELTTPDEWTKEHFIRIYM
jgi:5-methylcytosine-specific restriction endonuclease McrBC GTP-binding regulatory subunit McrB